MIKLKSILAEIMEENKIKVFVDMDGCLTDFTRAFQEASKGWVIKDKQGNVIDTADGSLSFEEFKNNYSNSQAWKIVMRGGLGFWENMEWMSDGKELWNYVNSTFGSAEILSAPSSDPNSAKGKLIWCKRELNPQPVKVNLVPAKDKHIFAKPNHILIDDKDLNIQQWKEKGGIGVLHKDTASSIKDIEEILHNLKEYSDGSFFIGQMNLP
jgi:hypothetical protein